MFVDELFPAAKGKKPVIVDYRVNMERGIYRIGGLVGTKYWLYESTVCYFWTI